HTPDRRTGTRTSRPAETSYLCIVSRRSGANWLVLEDDLRGGTAQADLFDAVFPVAVLVSDSGSGELRIGRLFTYRSFHRLLALRDYSFVVLQLDLVDAGFQFRARDDRRLEERHAVIRSGACH